VAPRAHPRPAARSRARLRALRPARPAGRGRVRPAGVAAQPGDGAGASRQRAPLRRHAAARLRAPRGSTALLVLRRPRQRGAAAALRRRAAQPAARLAARHRLLQLEPVALRRPELRDRAHVPGAAGRRGHARRQARLPLRVRDLPRAHAARLPHPGLEHRPGPRDRRGPRCLRPAAARHPAQRHADAGPAARRRLPGCALARGRARPAPRRERSGT
jgi:hypothetical protein